MIRETDSISGFRWLEMALLHLCSPARAGAAFRAALLEVIWLLEVITKIYPMGR